VPIPNLPDDTQRHVIIGPTGSGKTQAATFHLSHRDFHVKPWIIFDFKLDPTLNAIPHTEELNMEVDPVPTVPGVYIVHPHPDDQENVEAYMWQIWANGNTGVYVDEGLMIEPRKNKAFRALLTQGRSKHIPMIVGTQRPAWVNRFVFTESEFIQVFQLRHSDDIKTVQKFVPLPQESDGRIKALPRYYSWYYDVGENSLYRLTPVPAMPVILATFDRRLRPRREAI